MKFGTFFDENESSNDSIISLEMTGTSDGSVESESEGEGNLFIVEEDVSEKTSAENNNVQSVSMRKEKRRERNKRSAQAYRQRRRQERSKVDQVLHDLLDRNSILRQQVNRLEAEKNTTLELLKSKIKIAWPYPVWIHHRPGMMPEPSAVMTTPIAMDSSVQEVTVAS